MFLLEMCFAVYYENFLTAIVVFSSITLLITANKSDYRFFIILIEMRVLVRL